MKKTILILLTACLLTMAMSCKPKAENDNISFAATITKVDEDGILVETSADVGFTTALVHLADGYEPDFTIVRGQTVQLTILPMMTKSIPPQVTAIKVTLIAEPVDNGVASVTEGLDPMPMLTPGTDAVTDAEASDTPEAQMANMLPILDAIARTMGTNSERAYMPADAVFVWDVLAHWSGDWGHTVPEAVQQNDAIIVPESTLRAVALAAFNRSEALPPLPEAVAERVQYVEASKAYRIVRQAQQNEPVVQIDAFSATGDDGYAAVLGYYSAAGERINGMRFTCKDAPEGSGTVRLVVTNAVREEA